MDQPLPLETGLYASERGKKAYASRVSVSSPLQLGRRLGREFFGFSVFPFCSPFSVFFSNRSKVKSVAIKFGGRRLFSITWAFATMSFSCDQNLLLDEPAAMESRAAAGEPNGESLLRGSRGFVDLLFRMSINVGVVS